MRTRRPVRRRLAAVALALLVGAAWGVPSRPAHAWDPSTTHLGMLDRSVLDSAMHLRWMEASALRRGLFSPLRIDPERLDDATLRTLRKALRQVHADSGAQAMGGPGACPGASAPASTRAHCVEGDLWETTALGWMELGVIVESVPAERLLHHFVDRRDPAAARWSDDDLPRTLLRTKHAKAGGTLAARATGQGFEGSGRSAVAWLDDPDDPWAPTALAEHLRRASLAPTAAERDHHLALALLCTGALLHVLQDLSVPAHARGDVSALFLPLSEHAGDRGLPLQELARDAYGRGGLPTPLALTPRPQELVARGEPRASSLRAHVLGDETWPGLVHEAGRRFLSESSLPAARRVDPGLSAQEAAAALLGDGGAGLDPSEREGAQLAPWPSERGYLVSGRGTPLAAYRRDEEDRVHLWLDRRVYRTQMQTLIPVGVDAGRSVLDLMYAAWPQTSIDRAGRTVTVTPEAMWADATLRILTEDARGRRTPLSEVAMTGPQAHRVVDAWPAVLPEGTSVVLVLVNPEGRLPAVVETLVSLEADAGDDAEARPGVPRARLPGARGAKPGTRPTGARPPTRRAVPPTPEGTDPAAQNAEGEDPEAPEDPDEPSAAEPTDAEPSEAETERQRS